ncbi:hypothetical protein NB636_03200 [Oxalobacter aliiformigenes]|uniref:hypothetical protein n=1 Tax=Oxalobacter aliiformigenes TaxID=2946593 RepID=UPI0022AE6EFB|nr:hypothetical protein [Oxalobacter aliiformigenes]MCZ4065765.1 hypothetical protein [Oxalobacter aliiformigenes]WAV99871.1 hypothetical protein NB636_03200 [Oxalobacter aliiformigenes]
MLASNLCSGHGFLSGKNFAVRSRKETSGASESLSGVYRLARFFTFCCADAWTMQSDKTEYGQTGLPYPAAIMMDGQCLPFRLIFTTICFQKIAYRHFYKIASHLY